MNNRFTLVSDDTGDGDPVVMIHGLGGSSNTFEALMPELATYRCVRPDMPGAARTGLPHARLTLDVIVDLVADWMQATGLERCHLLGHSMGTLVCQKLAETRPELVTSMVLFGALTEPPDAARKGLLDRAAGVRKNGMDGVADQISKATLAPETHRENPVAAAFVRESLMRQPPEGYAQNCEALSGAKAAHLRKIKAPVLLVTGEHDPVAPVSMARLLNENIEGSEIRIIPGCGHWTPIERPRDCANATREFLQRHRI